MYILYCKSKQFMSLPNKQQNLVCPEKNLFFPSQIMFLVIESEQQILSKNKAKKIQEYQKTNNPVFSLHAYIFLIQIKLK